MTQLDSNTEQHDPCLNLGKVLLLAVALILGSASAGHAGVIYGQISVGSSSVGAGVTVEVEIGGKTYSAETDKNGLYRMNVTEAGKAVLRVHYNKQVLEASVLSFAKPSSNSFTIEKRNGKYVLKRR